MDRRERWGRLGRPFRGSTLTAVALLAILVAGLMPPYVQAAPATTAGLPPPATTAGLPPPARSGSEALLGTIGFRSARKAFLGQYVTTGLRISADDSLVRDRKLKARADAFPLLFELGLFRESASRFRLLGENGNWVTLKRTTDGPRFTASATKWSAASAFKVVRAKPTLSSTARAELVASKVDPGLPVCIHAYQGSTRRGFLVLNTKGWLTVSATAKCGASTRTLFMTDDLPVGAATSSLLVNPPVPVDEITRVRFVAPDRPAHKTGFGRMQRDAAIVAIEAFIERTIGINDQILTGAQSDLTLAYGRLSITNPKNDQPAGGSVDWFSIVGQAAVGATKLIPEAGPVISTTVSIQMQLAQVGISFLNTPRPQGPRVINGLSDQGRMVDVVSKLKTRLEADAYATQTQLYLLETMLEAGCPEPSRPTTCVSDRRLIQWTNHPVRQSWLGTTAYIERQRYAYSQVFYRKLVPIMGALVTKWTYVPSSDCFNRAFTREESLGDRSGYPGFGTSHGSETWDRVVVFTSVFQPWNNWKYGMCDWWATTRARPVMQAWTLGSATGGPNWEDDATPYTPETWRWMFAPYDPAKPMTTETGGLGWSPREVACTWLTQKPHGYQGGLHGTIPSDALLHPCHMSFYSPDTGEFTNNRDWWIGPQGSFDWQYTRQLDALAWYAPEPPEVAAGRPTDDPDIYSWIIPHLKWAPGAAPLQRSTGSGSDVHVYFANLSDKPVRVAKVNADGTTTQVISSIPVWTDLAHPVVGTGTIKSTVDTSSTPNLWTHRGAVFLVQADGGDGSWLSIGTYTVVTAARTSVPAWQVAEIHGHCETGASGTVQVGGILDHDACGT